MSVNTSTPSSISHRVQVARNVRAECVRQGHDPVHYLAALLNKHVSTIRRKFTGEVAFNSDELGVIAEALAISPAIFFPDDAPATAALDAA